jgi:hypothetical protein
MAEDLAVPKKLQKIFHTCTVQLGIIKVFSFLFSPTDALCICLGVCSFVFLPLQPTVVVFSQPSSGL